MKRIFWFLAGGLAIYEAAALVNKATDDTISEITWRAAKQPIVPFLAGFVMGHLFWQINRE